MYNKCLSNDANKISAEFTSAHVTIKTKQAITRQYPPTKSQKTVLRLVLEKMYKINKSSIISFLCLLTTKLVFLLEYKAARKLAWIYNAT